MGDELQIRTYIAADSKWQNLLLLSSGSIDSTGDLKSVVISNCVVEAVVEVCT